MMQKREDKIANDLDSAEQSRECSKIRKERQEKLARSHSEAAEIIKSAKDSGVESTKYFERDQRRNGSFERKSKLRYHP